MRLDDIGVYKKGPFGSALKKSLFVPKSEDTIKVYEQKNAIQKNSTLGEYYITQEYYQSKMKGFTVESGDIIVSCAGTIGETYVLPECIELGIINQALMRMNIVPSINLDYFLIYFDYILKKSAIEYSKGSAIKNIPPFKIFKRLIFPLPPIDEQKRIVNKIEEFLPLINDYGESEEKLSKLNSEFPDKLRSSILQYAIQGKLVPQDPNDEPAFILLEKIQEEKERLIKEKKIKRNKNESYIFKENNHFYEKIGNKLLCIDEEILFQIPKSWNLVRLGDIVYNFGQKKPDKTFSYIDVGSIDNKNLRLNLEENILTKDKAPSRARKIVKEGSIIYSTVRPYLLNMCIINKKFSHEPIASTAFAILNPFKGVNNKYLFYYLQSPIFINYVNKVMSGVAYPAINDKKLYNALITLPPLEEQKRIVEKIDSLFEELNFKS